MSASRALGAHVEAIEATRPRLAESIVDLSICVDCAVWTANADDSGIEDAAEFRARFAEHSAGLWHISVEADEGTAFSWTPCDTCGSHLGGDRYEAKAVVYVRA